jgi:alkylation response protein AidB-like acyl-CoA dehydrogenase
MKDQSMQSEILKTLPGDDVRQIMWRYADRYDLQMLVQSTRSVARGLVARLVANGARSSHEWNEKKAQLLQAFDEAGITAAFMDPEYGGYIQGPKNLVLALIAFELSWVDAGAATCSMAGNLALEPIHERGTPEQKAYYMSKAVPKQDGKPPLRGAFALTEPIPYVGVETSTLSGRVSIARWNEGEEPILKVEKRGRFITNMGFANFVTAAVDSNDPRIKGSCIVIIEENDPGTFYRGTPAKKLVHQLSSTRDPIFNVEVPASRIVGGYKIKDGVIVPNYNHSEIIEAVFKRTRVTVGLMTAAKLLSAVEPIIRYHRQRFRGSHTSQPGTPKYELGLQQKQDALHRLVDIWATGEAAASLGFATARLFDELDPLERAKIQHFEKNNIVGPRAQAKAMANITKTALEFLQLSQQPPETRDQQKYDALKADPLVQFAILDAQANVLCPATKLWNTGHGANMMREAVSLMGGYGITEDCPGFLGFKWIDSQLEATYEGPEAVQRRQLSLTMTNELFLALFQTWIKEMREIASREPNTGACPLATAMQLWLWTVKYIENAKDAYGQPLFQSNRQGVLFPLADALCWLLASRAQILDCIELKEKGNQNPALAEALPGLVKFFSSLAFVQAAAAAGEVGKICAELVFGYKPHQTWADTDVCPTKVSVEIDTLESLLPQGCQLAISSKTRKPGEPPPKSGPCTNFPDLDSFIALRLRLDHCLSNSRLAKEFAASAIAKVSIPEALDYPAM